MSTGKGMVVRISGNIDDLKRALEEGTLVIQRTMSHAEKLAASFKGDKLVAAAVASADAIGKVGASALTASERARELGRIEQALEKLKLTGQPIPPLLQDTADKLRGLSPPTEGFLSKLGPIGDVVRSAFKTDGVLGFTTALVSAQAIVGTIKGVVRALADELVTLTIHGSGVADVEENFRRLTAQVGRSADALLTTLRQGTHATINDFELMTRVNQDLAAGLVLTEEQYRTLTRGAFALAQATGGDVKSALDTMSDALLTGRTRSVAMLTGKIDLERAESAYAATLGVAREQLSETGKLEAARVGILDAVTESVERLGEQADGLDEQVAQAQTAWQNFQNDLGKTVANSPVLREAIAGIGAVLAAAFGGNRDAQIRNVADAIDAAAMSAVGLAEAVAPTVGFIGVEFNAIQKLFRNLMQVVDLATLGLKGVALAAVEAANWVSNGTVMAETVQRLRGEMGALVRAIDARKQALADDQQQQDEWSEAGARVSAELEKIRDRMQRARTSSAELTTAGRSAAGALSDVGSASGAAASAVKQTDTAAKELKQQLAAIAAVPAWQWIASAQGGVPAMLAVEDAADKVPPALRRVGKSLDEMEDEAIVAAAASFQLVDSVDAVPPSLRRVVGAAEQAGNAISDKLAAVITNLPQTFRAAFEGGGGVIGALKSIGTQMADALAGSFMEKLAAAFKTGSGFGAAFASAFNPALISITGIVAGLNSMIARQERMRAVSADNARLLAEGLAEYEQRLKDVTKEYDDLLATLEDVQLIRVTELSDMEAQLPILREMVDLQEQIRDTEQEIADLQDQLVPSWRDVEAAVRKYGLSIDGAGQKVQQLKIRQNALDFINDWEMLQRAGWDTAGMLDGMQDELNAMVQEAMKYGVELPANMKPVLEKLIEQGGLVDSNGEKLKDLTGIKFGAPVETEADKINGAIRGLIEKLTEFIGRFDALTEKSKETAEQLEEDWKTAPWEKWPEPRFPRMETGGDGGGETEPGPPRTPPGRNRPTALPGFANGTGGRFLDFGMGTPVVLHGRERVVTEREAASSQPITINLTTTLDGRVVARNQMRYLPSELALAGR